MRTPVRLLLLAIAVLGAVLLVGSLWASTTAEDGGDVLHLRKPAETPGGKRGRPAVSSELVCIVGVTEDAEKAWAVNMMWGSVIPSVWYVWGKGAAAAQNGRMTTVTHASEALPWTRGIELALAELRRLYRCHYIFTHEDDATFTVRRDSRLVGSSIASVLTAYLTDFKPAVASFIDPAVLAAAPMARAVHQRTAAAPVGPLVAFNPNLLIFHHDIVDFFIPYYAPRGDSGQSGNHTLASSFLHLFIAPVFREHAIAIQDLVYHRRRPPPRSPGGKGLAQGQQRYRDQLEREWLQADPAWTEREVELNKRYEHFLTRGLRRPGDRWGASLGPTDVTWDAEPGPLQVSMSWMLERIVAFYDLRHDAVSKANRQHARFAVDDMVAHMRALTIELHIYVLVDDVGDELAQLWNGLASQDLPSREHAGPYAITIHLVCRPWLRHGHDRRLPRLRTLHASYANVTITVLSATADADPQAALRQWNPASVDEYALFLDDRMTVSPYMIALALTAVRSLFYSAVRPKGLWGVSLVPPATGDVYAPSHLKTSLPDSRTGRAPETEASDASGTTAELLLLQYPAAIGTVFWAGTWLQLLQWTDELASEGPSPPPGPPLLIGTALSWLEEGPRMLQRYVARFAAERGFSVFGWLLPSGASLAAEVAPAEAAAVPGLGLKGGATPATTVTSAADVRTLRRLLTLGPAILHNVQMLDTYFQLNLVNRQDDVALLPPLRQATATDACAVVVHHNVGSSDEPLRQLLLALRTPPAVPPTAIVWKRRERPGSVETENENLDDLQQTYAGFLVGHDDPTQDGAWEDGGAEPALEIDGAPQAHVNLATLVGSTLVLDPLEYQDDHALLTAIRGGVKSSCIAIVDTATAPSRRLVSFALTLSQTQYQTELIGMRHGGLYHTSGAGGVDADDGTDARRRSDRDRAGSGSLRAAWSSHVVSIVPSTLAVFPVTVLDNIIDLLGASKATGFQSTDQRFVWRRCRGALLSVVSASATRVGPVVIDAEDHQADRARGRVSLLAIQRATRCLAVAHQLARAPLSTLPYTTSIFTPPPEPPLATSLAPVYEHHWVASLETVDVGDS